MYLEELNKTTRDFEDDDCYYCKHLNPGTLE